jgi:D-methionine transport system ATP-binding protein
MVFQHFNLLSAKTVWSNIALPLVVSGAPKAKVDERVAEVVALYQRLCWLTHGGIPESRQG